MAFDPPYVCLLPSKGHSCYSPELKKERTKSSYTVAASPGKLKVVTVVGGKVGRAMISHRLSDITVPGHLESQRTSRIHTFVKLTKKNDMESELSKNPLNNQAC